MTKYKLDKQVQERLDAVNELNIKIEEMSPNEARQIPWTAGDGDEIPDGKKIGDVKEASTIDPQSIDQAKLVPLLVKTIQELEARITALESA